jgi:hypothetical protein
VAYNVMVLALLLVVEFIFAPSPELIISAINRNGLAIFLLVCIHTAVWWCGGVALSVTDVDRIGKYQYWNRQSLDADHLRFYTCIVHCIGKLHHVGLWCRCGACQIQSHAETVVVTLQW